jgi:hypothetical protein
VKGGDKRHGNEEDNKEGRQADDQEDDHEEVSYFYSDLVAP